MEDKNFLVVPMVILTEGVHKGSGGPLYYPKDELSKTPAVWNHKPVVVYHPEINGQGVSACDPAIITNRKVGVMMNTTFDKGRLRSEAWIEKDRANKVDERILAAVEKNEMMEVSTGVFVDCESTEGEWKGEEYRGIARNYRPDHLAILPDKIGACSIADGAGFLRNEQGRAVMPKGIRKAFDHFLVRMGWVKASELEDNMSFSAITDQIRQALWDRLHISNQNYNGPYCYVADVYEDFVIYEFDNKLYRLGYTATDTGVTLSEDDPVEVKRVTEYRTTSGAFAGNQEQDQNTKQNNSMDKKKIVDAIILAAAALGTWTEADREPLMAMNEAQLKLIEKNVAPAKTTNNAAAAPVVPKDPPKIKKDEPKAIYLARCEGMGLVDMAACSAAWKSQTNADEEGEGKAKVVTLESYVEAAPAPMRDVLNNSLQVYNEEKAKLIEGILANKNHGFKKEDLENRPLGELRNLAALAGVQAQAPQTRTANYGGQGNVPSTNAEAEEPMEIPIMNYDQPGKKKKAAALADD